MNSLVENILPSIRIFNLSADIDEFQIWLKKEHGKILDNHLLHGYKFFIETAFQQKL